MDGMIDMARSESEKSEQSPLVQENKYPYGLRITLDAKDLEKLNVDHGEWEIGDVFPLDILAKVVGKKSNESEGGEANCCISLQITHIGAEEHEDTLEEEGEHEPYTRDKEEAPSLANHGYRRNGAY